MMTTQISTRDQARQVARAKLAEGPVYLDTETTGLDRSDEVVEISIVGDDGNVLFSSLVKPSQSIPPAATQVHHITNEMVQKAPSWPVLWPTIRSFLVGKVVATYNADFDLRLMQQSHARYRLPWKENLNMFCVMKLYAQFRGEWDPNRRSFRYFSLEQAGQQAKISIPNSHRASDDTLLARALMHYIAEVE